MKGSLLPAVKLPWLLFPGMVEVQAELGINAQAKVIIHVDDL